MAMDKTFTPAEAEARIAARWDDANAFAAGANAKPGADAFSIVIPPPNVTGALHMGHAFNNTLQDILTRWHRMRGHDTLWQPGTDHAGIATQMVVERELGKQGKRRTEFTREAFLDLVWQQKQRSSGNIREQLKRLGASCDWSREAFTMAGAHGDPDGTPGGQNFHDAVIRVFVEMYDKGLIYRGKRLVNWDPHFETAISDLEVENVEVPGQMWHFKYPLAGGETYEYVEKDEDGTVTLRETRDYISIATTRPETMLGDGAVAVSPSDDRYAPIVGRLCEIPVGPKEHRRLIPIITDEYPDPDFGSGAVKITGAHDFNDYAVAKRGGIPCYRLMDTRAHMRDDGAPYAEAATIAMAVAKGEQTLTEAEVDAVNLVPDDYRGLDRLDAREKIVAEITAEGLAVMVPPTDQRLGKKAATPPAPEEGGEEQDHTLVPLVEEKTLMQPFGDRSKVVIEPMLTDQWFVDAEKIVGPAIEAVRSGEVKILPERDAKVYFHWLENIEPWCISRQLWWGHQIPVWYGPHPDHLPLMERHLKVLRLSQESPDDEALRKELKATGDETARLTAFFDGSERLRICAASEAEAIKKAKALYGGKLDIQIADSDQGGFHPDVSGKMKQTSGLYFQDENWDLAGLSLVQDEDVLDTWFSSGLWPIGTLGWPEDTPELQRYFPTSTLVTGFDIIFFWVARMMMMQYAIVGQRPFDTVYVHALVRDEKGKKMSKSLGNVLDPLDLIDDYGADAVRFTLASMAAMGRDLKLSKDRIAGYRNFGTKLWNATRFAEMNGVFGCDVESYESHTGVIRDSDTAQTANKWILGELARTRVEVDTALDAFRFNDAAGALYGFVWGRVCDWYVEFAKPLLASEDPEIVAETRRTMRFVLERSMVLLHPFMPFVTEELWSITGDRANLLCHEPWPTLQPADIADEKADREMAWVINLIEDIRSLRAQMHVPAGAKMPLLQLDLDPAGEAAWTRNESLIHRLARVTERSVVNDLPKGAVTIPVDGGTFALPLADVIDVAEELERLDKTMAKLAKDMGGLKGRLNNPKFVASAPEDVIHETRDLLAQKEDEDAKLRAARDRLASLV